MARHHFHWSQQPIIALTIGDINGIGPEITLKSIAKPAVRNICLPLLIGPIAAFQYYRKRYKIPVQLEEITELPGPPVKGVIPVWNLSSRSHPRPGYSTGSAGMMAGKALLHAARLCLEGSVQGMVAAPVSKDAMARGGFHYPGQTEMLAEFCGRPRVAMMLVANSFRVALATVHLPLRDVGRKISTDRILEKLAVVHRSLRIDFNIRSPKIAVLGVNPHAGENGLLGTEEKKILIPALRKARGEKIDAAGPFPADGFFGRHAFKGYDAVLAMYHDQGLIPLKMAGFSLGVNYSAGLPIVRTSPDHGTAFDIAGKGIADPSSMIAAITLAVSIIRNRRRRL